MRALVPQTRLQEFAEQRMITKPAPIFIEGQDEQVLFKDVAHKVEPVLGFGIEWTQDKIAEFRVEFFGQGSSQQELTHRLRLLVQHLATQVRKGVHARDARHARRVR